MVNINKIKHTATTSKDIMLILAEERGLPSYFIIKVFAHKRRVLEGMDFSALVNLEDYGNILDSGYGLPSSDMLRRLRDTYGLEIKEYEFLVK